METRICVDTDVLVNLLRGQEHDVAFFEQVQGKSLLATTAITLFELYYGAYRKGIKKEINSVDSLVQRFFILHLTPASSRLAGKIKAQLDQEGKALEFRDVLIGCISIQEGYALKTKNKKHFERIPGLRIV